ncbi:MlaD family protein [Lutimaribacter marinistellae]|uniref:MlaD family protein n=1 Tax=Lutimaribacter marinistellae TaxID=1820329 RepID=A0ABV7TFD6_9RHOB
MGTYSSTEVLVGGAVVAVAIAFGIYSAQATGQLLGEGEYQLGASFRSLEGVGVGADVRLAGVKIGSVTEVALNPESYWVDTRFSVADSVQIPEDSAVVVSSEGLLGGNFIEVLPGESPFHFEPGDEVADTQGALSLIALLAKFVASNGGRD